MDEAFLPLEGIMAGLAPVSAGVRDDDLGVYSYIDAFEIESPVELDISHDETGTLRIGSTPPLYYVDTSLRPSYHRLRFRAVLTEGSDAG